MSNYIYTSFSDLLGQTLRSIVVKREEEEKIYFITYDHKRYMMHHLQDCCEHVYIEDICGDLDDLLDSPILLAEEVTNRTEKPPINGCESYTWTFYKLSTINGSVTIRWFGESNGYYSEQADFAKLKHDYMLKKHATFIADRGQNEKVL